MTPAIAQTRRHRRAPLGAALLALLWGAACQATPTEPPVAPLAQPAEAPEAPAAEAPAAEPPTPQLDLQDVSGRLRALGVIIEEMRAASARAAEGESTECGAAYAAAVAAAEVATEGFAAIPGARAPTWEVLPRDEYLAACEGLPEALRACARHDQRVANREACRAATDAASEEERAAFVRLTPSLPALRTRTGAGP